MNMIYLSGKYLNLDNVTEIIDGIDKVMMIEFVGGTRDYLAVESPEAAALRHHLRKVSVEVEAAYQSHLEEEEYKARDNKEWDEFNTFLSENEDRVKFVMGWEISNYRDFCRDAQLPYNLSSYNLWVREGKMAHVPAGKASKS